MGVVTEKLENGLGSSLGRAESNMMDRTKDCNGLPLLLFFLHSKCCFPDIFYSWRLLAKTS